jgi:hypothetical protein
MAMSSGLMVASTDSLNISSEIASVKMVGILTQPSKTLQIVYGILATIDGDCIRRSNPRASFEVRICKNHRHR